MKKYWNLLVLIISLMAVLHYAQANPAPNFPHIKTYKFSFSKVDNFKVSYADYPKGNEAFYELEFEQGAPLPKEIQTALPALRISGNNHSDDLFMYAVKKLKGLKPNTVYQVNFALEFASNAVTGSLGTGGSPGDSVYVKIGVVAQKPVRYLDEMNFYRMALDKGNQATDGKDLILLGTIGVDTEGESYRLKTLPYQPNSSMQQKLENYQVITNDKGNAWLVVGTDSGFESKSTVYYTNVVIGFKEIGKT